MRYPFMLLQNPSRSALLPDSEKSAKASEGQIIFDEDGGVYVCFHNSINTLVDDEKFAAWVTGNVLAQQDSALLRIIPHLIVDRAASDEWATHTLDVKKADDVVIVRHFEQPLLAIQPLSIVRQGERTIITWLGSGLAVQNCIEALTGA